MSEFQWYSREERGEPWLIAACSEHGAALERLRFQPIGDVLDQPGADPLPAEFCAICRDHGSLEAIGRCTCEVDPELCPEHSELALTIKAGEEEILDALSDLASMANDALDLFEKEGELPGDTYNDLINAARRAHSARSNLNIPYHRWLMLSGGVRTDGLGREIGRVGNDSASREP